MKKATATVYKKVVKMGKRVWLAIELAMQSI